jgi:hypothetical protein
MGGFTETLGELIGYEDPPQQQQVQQQAVKEEPTGPTKAQMADKRKLSGNRRGRSALILKSNTGVDEDITLGKKALLG